MSAGWVRDLFDAARQARSDLEHMRARLVRLESAGISSGIPQAIGGGGKSDPTATVGLALADYDSAEHRAVEAQCLATIDRALAIIAGLRAGFRISVADVIEDYYLRGLSWGQVAAIEHLGKATCLRLRDLGFDWIAAVGEERAARGEGLAEDG